MGLGYKTRRIRSSPSSYSPARSAPAALSVRPSVRLPSVLKYIVFDLLLAVCLSLRLLSVLAEAEGSGDLSLSSLLLSTELFVQSVAMFCYVFPHELRGPAWALQ